MQNSGNDSVLFLLNTIVNSIFLSFLYTFKAQ
ncbi:hypothetical protein BH09BAC6_BH09BAC6_36330 [soil metagenome]